MSGDVEQRLRDSLQARARDVRPDPATWERVSAGIRRRQRVRWALAGAAAAAVVAVAVLVTPALLGSRVDLDPVPPADQSGLGTTVGAGGALVTDGAGLRVVGADGETRYRLNPPEEADEPLPFERVAVRPGSTVEDLTAMYVRADADCERVELGWVAGGEDDSDRPDARRGGPLGGGQGLCITDLVWSPDGGHVAWVERHADGQFWLRGLAWDADAPAGGAANSYKVGDVGDGLDELRLTDWVVAGAKPEATLHLTGVDGGQAQSMRLTVEHHDGGVEPEGALVPAASSDGGNAEATEVLAKAPDGDDPTTVRLLAHPDGTARLASRDLGGERELPTDVLHAEDARSGDVWLAARGEDVLLGFDGRAWHVRRSEDGFGDPEELAGTVVHADLLDAGLGPDPDEAGEPDMPPASEDDPLLTTDGGAIALHGPDGPTVVARADETQIIDFTVHPASTPDDLTVVWREGLDCDATLQFVRIVDGSEDARGQVGAGCPGTPVFSPDGSHLAWMSQPEPSEEPAPHEPAFGLEARAWDGGPTGGLTIFELSADPAETMSLDLHDWVWTDEGNGDAAGTLHLSGYDGHGTVRAYTAPIERQADGALALPADATARTVTPLAADADATAVLQVDAHHDTVRVTYTLEQRRQGQESELAVVRTPGGTDEEVLLPDDLLRVNTTGAEPQDRVWLAARGDTVLFGDGDARAWVLPWPNAGGDVLRQLKGNVRFAVPLGSDPAPRQEEAPSSEQEGLPEAVADTRRAILQAARDEDVDALATLTGPDFTSSFGGPEDPHVFFTRLRDDGELEVLVRILELAYGTREVEGTGTIFAWPAVFTVPPEDWGEAEHEQLRALGSPEQIERWQEFGGYIGWRVGIQADGTWRYYVAGD